MAGVVFAGEAKVVKAGQPIGLDVVMEVRGRDHPWVSRGGVKLAHGLERFAIEPAGLTALDVGSSTGGFTDVLLSRRAARVYAVDSGTNQLAWPLRQDARVVVLEQLSARLLTREHIPEPIDLIVCDASFIALHKVLPVPLSFANAGATLVALIKPQFELEPGQIGKGGVVRDSALRAGAVDGVAKWLTGFGWGVVGVTESPITGPKGNHEFLIAARGPDD